MQPGGGGNLIRGRSRGGTRGYGGRGMSNGEQSAPIDEGGGYTRGLNPSLTRSRGGGGEHSASINQGYRGGSYQQSRGIGGRGMGNGEQSAPIDEGDGYTRGRNPSLTRSRGGGDNSGDLGGDTARPVQGPSTSQGYGFRVGDYSRREERTQYQQLPPSTGTSAVRQASFAQSHGYGGGPRGSQRQGIGGAQAQETRFKAAPVGNRKASIEQDANDDWARQNREAMERNKGVVPQETPIKPPEKLAVVEKTLEKQVDRTEQKQIPQQPPTFRQAPAPIRQPAGEVPPTQGGTLGKSSFDVMRGVQQRVSTVQQSAPSEVTRSTIQAPAPVTNASNSGGDIATIICNAATNEQIEELVRLVDNLSQTFARMGVLIKSFKE